MITNLSLPTVLIAAAIDSINPCAIGVLVFMMTFLSSMEGARKKILTLGGLYILVVYICYFLAGITLVKGLSSFDIAAKIYTILGFLVIALGIADVIDGLTKNPKPLLSIPSRVSPKIKSYISKATVPAVMALGAIVSLFELPCTGGVYIAITGMLARQAFNIQAIELLALYNFIFVLPLLIIMLLAAFGLSSDKIEAWRKKNRTWMRFFVGLGMVALGILMITKTV